MVDVTFYRASYFNFHALQRRRVIEYHNITTCVVHNACVGEAKTLINRHETLLDAPIDMDNSTAYRVIRLEVNV